MLSLEVSYAFWHRRGGLLRVPRAWLIVRSAARPKGALRPFAYTGPRASMRARSYHASPGACQAGVVCISLWMNSVNMLVNRCAAVDGRGCGKVDNRRDITSHQVVAFGCPQAARSTHR